MEEPDQLIYTEKNSSPWEDPMAETEDGEVI
jgi:hypothetical protein